MHEWVTECNTKVVTQKVHKYFICMTVKELLTYLNRHFLGLIYHLMTTCSIFNTEWTNILEGYDEIPTKLIGSF